MAENAQRTLLEKLGVESGSVFALVHAPKDFVIAVDGSVTLRRAARGHADVVLAFFTDCDTLAGELNRLATMIYPEGGLWIAWPKRRATLATNLTDVVVRDTALSDTLVDNKVCSVNETWSALRFVWRVERRTTSA